MGDRVEKVTEGATVRAEAASNRQRGTDTRAEPRILLPGREAFVGALERAGRAVERRWRSLIYRNIILQ